MEEYYCLFYCSECTKDSKSQIFGSASLPFVPFTGLMIRGDVADVKKKFAGETFCVEAVTLLPRNACPTLDKYDDFAFYLEVHLKKI